MSRGAGARSIRADRRSRALGLAFQAPTRSIRPMPHHTSLIATIVARLRAGSSVAVVCRTGAERGAFVAAAVCVALGLPPAVAWSHVERSRRVPLAVSPAQRVWLDRFAGRVGSEPARVQRGHEDGPGPDVVQLVHDPMYVGPQHHGLHRHPALPM